MTDEYEATVIGRGGCKCGPCVEAAMSILAKDKNARDEGLLILILPNEPKSEDSEE